MDLVLSYKDMENLNKKGGLESVYNYHHTSKRGDFFLVLGEERGSFLKEKIGTGKNVVDIGCRDGALTAHYQKGNTVLGCDIDSEALARAEKSLGITTKQMDLNADWDLPKDTFDVVVAAEVVEHLYYPEIVFKKVASILKPGGIFVGSIPHAFSLPSRIKLLLGIKQGTPLQDPTHINHFCHKEFKMLMEKQFSDVEIRPIVPQRYRILSIVFPFLFAHDILFYGKKK